MWKLSCTFEKTGLKDRPSGSAGIEGLSSLFIPCFKSELFKKKKKVNYFKNIIFSSDFLPFQVLLK